MKFVKLIELNLMTLAWQLTTYYYNYVQLTMKPNHSELEEKKMTCK